MGSTANLWELFVNAGYLTIADKRFSKSGHIVLRIPNQEVLQEFQNLTAFYLNVSDTNLTDLFDALYEEKTHSLVTIEICC